MTLKISLIPVMSSLIFPQKEMAMEVLDLAIAHKKALVCGSTGFSAEEMKRFEEAGKQIPMLYAANTSKLVNIMNKLLELVTATLKRRD